MIVALLDNGSLAPAAHLHLRATAAALSARVGTRVHAVSWKHSDRLPASALDGTPAWTLAPFVRALVALGQREFLFVPFFISPQGAIGSALRRELDDLRRQLGPDAFDYAFTSGLAEANVLPAILADRIRDTLAGLRLPKPPPVIVVDHGGPSPHSASLRDTVAVRVRATLGRAIGPLSPASMEGADHPHNRPLLADLLATPPFASGDVIIAPLFLSPGRHAGPDGDLARIVRAASPKLRCHFADLVGSHPLALDTLERSLRHALSSQRASAPTLS